MDIFGIRGRLDHARLLARDGCIDEAAASTATASVTIDAPVDVVWAAMANLEGWPGILPGVSQVVLDHPDRPLAPGEGFSWRSGGVRLRSVVQRVVVDAELTWTGRAIWLVAVHRNTIVPLGGGSCRLTSRESMTGPLAGVLMPPAKLQVQLRGFVDAIAAAAENGS